MPSVAIRPRSLHFVPSDSERGGVEVHGLQHYADQDNHLLGPCGASTETIREVMKESTGRGVRRMDTVDIASLGVRGEQTVITTECLLAERDVDLIVDAYGARESQQADWQRLKEHYKLDVCHLKVR